MTAQIPERLVYKGDDFRLCSEPLEVYFEKLGHRPTLIPSHTCRRGYIGTWGIKENKLYLVEILIGDGSRPWGKVLSDEDRAFFDALDEMDENTVTPETLFHGQSLPVFASWFTGVLSLEQGEVTDYVRVGYGSTYENELLLRVENGVVIGEHVDAMKLFFDTEFASLEAPNAGLISIGFVAENGQEFYAELTDTYESSMCSDFVITVVLPLLNGGDFRLSQAQLAFRLKAWIESFKQELVLISDNPAIDFPFIYDLFEKYGWPQNLPMKCEPLYFSVSEKNGEKFHQALEDFWLKNADYQHHALVDARSMKIAWSSCHE